MMRRIHEAHVASERLPAEQCATARERLAETYGRDYSIYLIGWPLPE